MSQSAITQPPNLKVFAQTVQFLMRRNIWVYIIEALIVLQFRCKEYFHQKEPDSLCSMFPVFTLVRTFSFLLLSIFLVSRVPTNPESVILPLSCCFPFDLPRMTQYSTIENSKSLQFPGLTWIGMQVESTYILNDSKYHGPYMGNIGSVIVYCGPVPDANMRRCTDSN